MLDVAVVGEVFGVRRRGLGDRWYELRMCGVEPGVTMAGAGFAVEMTDGLDGLVGADTVIVLGGEAGSRSVQEALVEAYDSGARIAALGSGVFVVAAAGLLAARHATTHWLYVEELARRHPDVVVDRSVSYSQDGAIFTSAGGATTLELCLDLVGRDHGAGTVEQLARCLNAPLRPLLPGAGDGDGTTSDDDLVHVLDWALARIDQRLTLRDLAEAGHMSTRTLARRFQAVLGTTPLQWLLAERVRLAQRLLESTDEPVESIAHRAGLGSSGNLRQHFTRMTGLSPYSYRRAHRAKGRRSAELAERD